MLFKALIERLLGSDEAQDWNEQERTKTSRFSYNNYPSLVPILESLLDPSGPLKQSMTNTMENSPMDLHGAEGVFPALQILRQASPPDPARLNIIESIGNLLKSPHWHLRDMAARTLVSLHRPHEYCAAMQRLVSALMGAPNFDHGNLLALSYMLKKCSRSSHDNQRGKSLPSRTLLTYLSSDYLTPVDDLCKVLLSLLDKHPVIESAACPFTHAAFLDVLNVWMKSAADRPRLSANELETQVRDRLSRISKSNMGIVNNRMTGTSLLNRALNRRRLFDTDINRLGAFLALADEDPDTCCDVLESLGSTLPNMLSQPAGMDCLALVKSLVLNARDDEVQSTAQALLAECLENEAARDTLLAKSEKWEVFESLDVLEEQCLHGSPANAETASHLLGFYLDHAYGVYPDERADILQRLSRFIRLSRMIMIDTNVSLPSHNYICSIINTLQPFDARFATAKSLSTFHHIWTIPPNSNPGSPVLLALTLLLHDLLNDDDDEIRDLAASTTARFLRIQDPAQHFRIQHAVPITAVERLATFIVTQFSGSRELGQEALRRLMDVERSGVMFEQPFAQRLQEARKEDTALFVKEKQNLFQDDAMDVLMWSNVLTRLSPATIRKTTKTQLAAWTLDALSLLTETAEKEVDGPLGWTTTKADVFTLGLRVVCAADVALRWAGPEKAEVMLALRRFVDVGLERKVNGIWLEKAEKVLGDSVVRSLRRLRGELLEI